MKARVVMAFSVVLFVGLLAAMSYVSSGFSKANGCQFGLFNNGVDYSYTLWVNEEPISWGEHPGLTSVSGYPLRTGTNRFLVILDPLTLESNHVPRFSLVARLLAAGKWQTIDALRMGDPVPDGLKWTGTFQVPGDAVCGSIACEVLPGDRAEAKAACEVFAVEIARVIATRRADVIAGLFVDVTADHNCPDISPTASTG